MKGLWERLKAANNRLKGEVRFVRALVRHPRTPWISKGLLGLALLYLVLPFDLIPDFIPVLGLLDDLVVVGGLVFVAVRLAPRDVVPECRIRSRG